jgi:transposase-like protein
MYFAFRSKYMGQIKTSNPMERIIREIRRRTRVVGAFPDGHSALMRVAVRLPNSTKRGNGWYVAMEVLLDPTMYAITPA